VIIELPPSNGFLPDEVSVPEDTLLAYVCSRCDLIYNRTLVGTSNTYDPVALRAHAGVLQAHARFYGHTIQVFDTLIGDFTGTIPETPRLQ
jgi:hypothetical protein